VFFKQFYLPELGHASYLVGDEGTGKAFVLDPRRDVDVYLDAARAEGLRIVNAIDTHGHNDYLSGLVELKARQDVELLGYHDAPLGYDHRPVKDGEVMEMGDVALEILHTPGHTPEHVSILLYDRSVGSEPAVMLSGGSLLVGDIARPDLLGGKEEAFKAARDFCHTLQEKILWRLDDHVEVFPTHVSGSLCGGNIGSRLSTTVGYERKTNAVLAKVSSSEEFVDECIRLDNLPAVPPYWKRMRSQNLAGPPLLGPLSDPVALPPEEFERAASEGLVVLDTRSPLAYAGGHIEGSLNVGLGSSFPTWAGTVLPGNARVALVLDRPSDLKDVTWSLLRIGYVPPVCWLAGGMQAWGRSGRPIASLATIDIHELAARVRAGELPVVDVRQPSEWANGHIEGATFITAAELPERFDEVPDDRPVAVVCGSGYRSSVAASLLASKGRTPISVPGGMGGWRSAGYPTID
jgi:hydroxyacylglutathione hydrolase